jgi:hypothetical protein
VEYFVAQTVRLTYARGLFRIVEMSKVIVMSNKAATLDTSGAPVVSGGNVDVDIVPVQRGVPHTVGEWTALVKIASSEVDIPPADCMRLIELGLVQCLSGIPVLTPHGRLTLGLAN